MGKHKFDRFNKRYSCHVFILYLRMSYCQDISDTYRRHRRSIEKTLSLSLSMLYTHLYAAR